MVQEGGAPLRMVELQMGHEGHADYMGVCGLGVRGTLGDGLAVGYHLGGQYCLLMHGIERM